jgi:replicative DNA helicase
MDDFKQAPNVKDFEDSVLSAALVLPSEVLDIVDSLQAHHFYSGANSKIFGIIAELVAKGITPDLAAVHQIAKERDMIEQIGGALGLSRIVDSPVPTDLEHYILKIREKYALRKGIEICNAITKRCYRDGGDARETIDRFQQEIFELGYGMQKESVASFSEIIQDSFDHYEMLYERGNQITGLATGFHHWDDVLCGMQKTDLIILAARPSMGKTSLALQVAFNVASDGTPVAIFSLEMSKAQLRDKAIAFDSGINTKMFRSGGFTADEMDQVKRSQDKLYSYPLYIDDTAALHWMEIKRRARKYKVKYGIELVIIDHLQLVQGDSGDNRNTELGVMTAGFKAMAKDLDIPVMVLSQLNRKLESRPDKRPMLSDLRESGNIEQDADVCSFLYRPGYYELEEEIMNQTDIMTLKQRNGPVGNSTVQFHPKTASFVNVAFGGDDGRGWGE